MKIILIALVLLTTQISLADDCIMTSQIRRFNALDEQTVEIHARKALYVMDIGYCSEVVWAHRIAFDTFGSPRVCRGDRLLVIDNFSDKVIQSCHIYSILKTK